MQKIIKMIFIIVIAFTIETIGIKSYQWINQPLLTVNNNEISPRKNAGISYCILFTETLGVNQKSDLTPGGIKLLTGYNHKTEQGVDSNVGKIWKEGGITITYDIGNGVIAGNYIDEKQTNEYLWYKKQIINRQNVRCALTKEHILVISFPDDSANFFSKVNSEEDVTEVLLMILTYEGHKISA